MLYYLATKSFTQTIESWLSWYDEALGGCVRILPYSSCHGSVPAGTFIFSDIERLGRRATRRAARLHETVTGAGCNTLNHPLRSLRRYKLQKALANDFRVFRPHEIPEDLRYPVFLRIENDHQGSLTPLLENAEAVRKARKKFPKALLVEFLDTRSGDGYFRKYAAMRIGPQIIPRHVLFSEKWVVKEPKIVTDALVREELEYVLGNPHEKELLEVFERAEIEFGRIDYSVYEGRLQIWEINSNPTLESPLRSTNPERFRMRQEVHDHTAAAINRALLELDATAKQTGDLRLGFPRTLRPESRFVDVAGRKYGPS